MSDHRHSGRATGSMLLLLLLLSGAGGWNYHRNWQIEIESEGQRPYARYAVEDLQALRAAYESEVADDRIRFDAARRNRARPVGDVGSIAGNIDQFQRATRTSNAIRDAAGQVAAGESELAELDRELELRQRFGQGLERHLKRLTTL